LAPDRRAGGIFELEQQDAPERLGAGGNPEWLPERELNLTQHEALGPERHSAALASGFKIVYIAPTMGVRPRGRKPFDRSRPCDSVSSCCSSCSVRWRRPPPRPNR